MEREEEVRSGEVAQGKIIKSNRSDPDSAKMAPAACNDSNGAGRSEERSRWHAVSTMSELSPKRLT